MKLIEFPTFANSVIYDGCSPWGKFKTVVVINPQSEGIQVYYRRERP